MKSDTILSTRTIYLPLLLLIISLFIFELSGTTVDNDLWGHLKLGEDIFSHRAVPRQDTYSYTFYGQPMYNHEWLGELILFAVFRFAGGTGLIVLRYAIAFALLFFLYQIVRRQTKSITLLILVIVPALSVIATGFALRPQMFTYLFLAIFMCSLILYEESGNIRSVLILPLLFALWNNLHGGFLAGLAILGVYIIGNAASRKRPRPFLVISGLCFLASLVHPNGIHNMMVVLDAVIRKRPYIEEWARMPVAFDYIIYFWLVFLALAAFFLSKRKRVLIDFTVVAILLFVSWVHRRHSVIFALSAALYLPKYLDSYAGEWLARAERKIHAPVFVSLFAAASLALLSGFASANAPVFRLRVDGRTFPVHAVRFMRANGLRGNLFSSFNWGMMCLSELSDLNKVFFDGRYEMVYPDAFIRDYFQVLFGKRDYRSVLDKYPQTDSMLLNVDEPLAKTIAGDAGWIRVYARGNAAIYLRNSERNKAYIERYRAGTMVYPRDEESPYYIFDKVTCLKGCDSESPRLD